MNKCPSCEFQNPEGSSFCAGCGTKLPEVCSKCGENIIEGARFCTSCGARLNGDTKQKSEDSKSERHSEPNILYPGQGGDSKRPEVTSPLSEEIEEGENRIATVLFADMSESVRSTANLSAEDAAELVNRLLRIMVDTIKRYGGRVDRLLGDGVLAVFGVPKSFEDDPYRAATTALSIRDTASRLGFDVTCGINTGEVYFGKMGSSKSHSELTVMGSAVNLAARLQSTAQPGQILIGKRTKHQIDSRFELSRLNLNIKGLNKPVESYELQDMKSGHSDTVYKPGLFIGREDELHTLINEYDNIFRGSGSVVTISGAAGVGKSRLLAEFRQKLFRNKDEFTLLTGKAYEMTTSTAYAPIIDMLQEHIGIQPTSKEENNFNVLKTYLQNLTEKSLLSDSQYEESLLLLSRLFQLPHPDIHLLEETTPESLRNRTFVSLIELVEALAMENPVVIVMEDLHWSDALTQALMPELMEKIIDNPVMLLLTFRPGYQVSQRVITHAQRRAKDSWQEVTLRPLREAHCKKLIESLLPDYQATEASKKLILEKSEGNPFYLEEVVQACKEAGLITPKKEFDGEEFERILPESLQHVILSRIDRLNKTQRELLLIASVLGRTFRVDILKTMLDRVDQPTNQLMGSLEKLETAGMVHLDQLVPRETWAFKHSLTQESIYKTLVKSKRSRLHKAAAQTIEIHLKSENKDPSTAAEELAHHWNRSRDAVKAVEALYRAGIKAAKSFDNEESSRFLTRALEQHDNIPDDEKPHPLLADIHEQLGDIHSLLRESEQGESHYRTALELQPDAESLVKGRLYRKLAKTLFQSKQVKEAEKLFQKSEHAFGTEPWKDPNLADEWMICQADLGWMYYFNGQTEKLDQLIQRIEPKIQKYGSDTRLLHFNILATLLLLRKERYTITDELETKVEFALKLARKSGDPLLLGSTMAERGFINVWKRNYKQAEKDLVNSIEYIRRTGDMSSMIIAYSYLPVVYRRLNQVDEAEKWANKALQLAEKLNMTVYSGVAMGTLGWVCWKRGNEEGALSNLEQAITDLNQDKMSLKYPFYWIVQAVKLAISVENDNLESASEAAKDMIGEEQQKLPERLETCLKSGMEEFRKGNSDESMEWFQKAVAEHQTYDHI